MQNTEEFSRLKETAYENEDENEGRENYIKKYMAKKAKIVKELKDEKTPSEESV